MSVFVRQSCSVIDFSSGDSWVILNPIEQRIKSKIECVGTPLRDWNINIYRGVLTGYNEAFIINGTKKDEILANCKTENERSKTEQLIRPILRGRDIKRYGYEWAGLYVILAHYGSYKILEKEYPAIYDHLSKYKPQLEQRGQCRYTSSGKANLNAEYPGQHHWLELDNNPTLEKLDDFSKQKIVWGNLNLSASYAIAPEGFFVNAPCPLIIPANKYLLAILNSKLADFYIRILAKKRNGGYIEYKPMFIERLPVPIIPENEQEKLVSLVEEINNATADSKLKIAEQTIDNLTYELYGLTKEEIQFIELQ